MAEEWHRVNDDFTERAVFRRLEHDPLLWARAVSLATAADCYASRNATDGRIELSVLRRVVPFKVTKTVLKSLLSEPEPFGRIELETFVIADFTARNRSRSEREADRAGNAKRQQNWRDRKQGAAKRNGERNALRNSHVTQPQTQTQTQTQVNSSPIGEEPLVPGSELQSEIRKLESRYDAKLVAEARQACALSRCNGKMADSVWLKVLRQLASYGVEAVQKAFLLMSEKYADGEKDERYLAGIARREHQAQQSGMRLLPGYVAPAPASPHEAFGEPEPKEVFQARYRAQLEAVKARRYPS